MPNNYDARGPILREETHYLLLYSNLQITSSGYAYEQNRLPTTPDINFLLNSPPGNVVFAPVWSSADGRLSETFYRHTNDTNTIEQIQGLLSIGRERPEDDRDFGDDFPVPAAVQMPTFIITDVLVITWVGLQAAPAGQPGVDQGLQSLGVS